VGGYVIPWIEALGIVVVLWGIVEALLALSRRAWRAAAGHTALGDLGAAESIGELNIGHHPVGLGHELPRSGGRLLLEINTSRGRS
jgi:hypothetical protein